MDVSGGQSQVLAHEGEVTRGEAPGGLEGGALRGTGHVRSAVSPGHGV